MIPVVAQTVALFCERPMRERVGHLGLRDRDLRLGQVGLDAEALDHRVQLGRLLRRDLAGAHRAQRELVGGEELGRANRPPAMSRIMTPLAPAANSAPMNAT